MTAEQIPPPPPPSRFLQISPDGKWGWTGEDWEPARAAAPPPVAPAPPEEGPTGYLVVKPAQPDTVAHIVSELASFEQLAPRLGVPLERLRELNGEHGGWSREEFSGRLRHVRQLTPGTIIHLPLGTRVPVEQLAPAVDRYSTNAPSA